MLFIPRKFTVVTHKCIASSDGCGNDDPVERVGMGTPGHRGYWEVVEGLHYVGGDVEDGDTVGFDNRTHFVGAVGFETASLLELHYLDERHLRDSKLVLIIADTVAQGFRQTAFLVRNEPDEGVCVEQVSHASRPKGSATSSLYLVSLTIFLGVGRGCLTVFLRFLTAFVIVFSIVG